MTFSEKLVILRKKYGLTQDDLAKQLGVSRQSVYKWECGQSYPEVPKLLEIKLHFNVNIDDLLDDSYEMPLPEKKKRKRLSKETIKRIEESVEAEHSTGMATATSVAAAIERAPEPVKAAAVEPERIEAAVEVRSEEPAAESVAESVAEPVAEPAAVVEEQRGENILRSETITDKSGKKVGFFGKLFGKK